MAKKGNTIPPGKLALYDKLVALYPGMERKGDSIPYTSLNGHMFSYMKPDGSLILRLSDEDKERFLKKYKTPPVESYGIIQTKYVAVPDALLKKTAELKKYFEASYAHVQSLKPKATAKKKTEKK